MNRSANHGIKGYLYQFLNTIERILALQSGEEIEIEGIEDIDVHDGPSGPGQTYVTI